MSVVETKKFELNFSNYAPKSDIKTQQLPIHQHVVKKDDLANLKPDIDKLGIGNLETDPADFSKLSHVVENVVEKAVYDDLVKKVNAIQTIDTSNLVKKSWL